MDKSAENKGIILIIDDEETLVQATEAALEIEGYTVLKAPDGEQGIAAFTRNIQQIRLVLCDLNMPHRNGSSTIHSIMAMKPSIKIIVMSGSIDKETIPPIVNHPSCLFLQKPFSVQVLIECVEKMMGSSMPASLTMPTEKQSAGAAKKSLK